MARLTERTRKQVEFPIAGYLRRNSDRSHRPVKTALLVARRIAAHISSRALNPGDMLPPEREMLTEYEVGRGTLREALRYLEIQGLIAIKPGPGGGPVVSIPNGRSLAVPLSIMLQFARTPFRTIRHTQSVVEPVVAEEAARNVNPEHLEQIRESVEKLEGLIGDMDALLEENSHFHELIAWSSGNTLFSYLLSSLQWINDGKVMGVEYPVWAQKVIAKAHRRIYEAIKRGDAEGARREMASHNAEYQRYMDEHYPRTMDEIVRWNELPD